MVFIAIYRSRVTRFVAALIIALVVSPYSEPFATIDGTDFGGAGAVDVLTGSKVKTAGQDVCAVPPVVAVFFLEVSVTAAQPLRFFVTTDPRCNQRAILRV